MITPRQWLPPPPWQGPPLPYWMVLPQKEAGAEQPPVQRPPAGALPYAGPGCKAADSCLLVHGYLVHLAEGKSGFGVLKVAKARLEEGAKAANQLGQSQLADEMRAAAQELAQVRTPAAAAALAPRLKELSDQTWDLGRRCGGHASPQVLARPAR